MTTMHGQPDFTIARLDPADVRANLQELGALLHACVHAGASIGFILPFAVQEAEAFWRDNVLPAVRAGERVLLVVRARDRIAGSVQLDHATPANQPHPTRNA
mgnify:CR=1 FL=1